MPNRMLTATELEKARTVLVEIRARLEELAGGDPQLLFAYRRKVTKELGYDERDKPSVRAKLKELKWGQQNGRCAECNEQMPKATLSWIAEMRPTAITTRTLNSCTLSATKRVKPQRGTPDRSLPSEFLRIVCEPA